MGKYKISVVVPVYKAENFLRMCVDSILQQTLKDVEIVLVDDGSPDRSGQICDEYATQHQNVMVIHQENGGINKARYAGVKKATSEIGSLSQTMTTRFPLMPWSVFMHKPRIRNW